MLSFSSEIERGMIMSKRLSLTNHVWLTGKQLLDMIIIMEQQSNDPTPKGDHHVFGKFAEYDVFIDSDGDVQALNI